MNDFLVSWRSFGLPIACALAVLASAAPAAGPTLAGQQLVRQLRAGGYVLVMRHAQSPNAAPPPGEAEADNPKRERQLDEAGKASARELGAALRALKIPIGHIYSSPAFRALQTVRLLNLGSPNLVPQLGESSQGMAGAIEPAQISWLRVAVQQSPAAGSDALIITHTPNIVGAFGRGVADIKAGEMLVFRPMNAQPGSIVGRITVDEWQRLAAHPQDVGK